MHAKLGTTEVDYQELAKISAVERHAKRGSPGLRSARRHRRKWLLDVSREALLLELESHLRRSLYRLQTISRRVG